MTVSNVTGVPISTLPAGGVPLSGAEILPMVQGGTTVRATAQDIANLASVAIPSWVPSVLSALAPGNTDNWAPVIAGKARLRVALSGDSSITGLVGGSDGLSLMIQNTSLTNTLTITVEGAGSTAANRFAANGDVLLPPRCGALFIYDGTLARWVKA